MSPAPAPAGAVAPKPQAASPIDRHFLVANLIAWVVIGMWTIAARSLFFQDSGLAFSLALVSEPVGFFYTWLLHLLYRRQPSGRFASAEVVLLVIVLSGIGGLIEMLVVAPALRWVFAPNALYYATGGPVVPFLFYTSIFLIWSSGYFWLAAAVNARHERLARSEAEASALQAELGRLRLQIDPHFLFNALNTVAAEIPDRPERALDMTHRIADYLRAGLMEDAPALHPLSEELKAVHDYIGIQELRFEDRLHTEITVPRGVAEVRVPRLLLQGLVENAVKHGLKAGNGALTVRVTARALAPQGVELAIVNPGRFDPKPESELRQGTGLGLGNARRRLSIHFPERHRLDVEERNGEVVVTVAVWGRPCFG